MKSIKGLLIAVFVLILACNNPSTASVPVAQFSGTPIIGLAPLSVQFNDTSSNTPTGWAWYFGDETYTEPWTLINSSAGWSGRIEHTSVVMPDGSIVLMGGNSNDVWRSTDYGATWSLVNASAGWSARFGHTSVVMPDGSIVLMGGSSGTELLNDVWQSIDDGTSWTLMNASAGWSERVHHRSVAMPDGSIVLMGGLGNGATQLNDVWRSTNNGTTWMQVNSSPGWLAREHFTSVALPDGSIVLMGGLSWGELLNDVWQSTDDGATWSLVNASAGWSARLGHTSVVMPDGSIVLIGGNDGIYKNDVWRSIDNGATWTQVNSSAGWSPRQYHTSMAMLDGSIVLMGGDVTGFGNDYKNDVWRLMPAGSTELNPVHTYTTPGTYQVALQVYNSDGYNSTLKTEYITITGISDVGVFNSSSGIWFMDTTKTGVVEKTFQFGKPGDISIVGDWDGNGISDAGVFRPLAGSWYMDTTKTGVVNKTFQFGKPGDIAVVGDWDGNGISDAGVFRESVGDWYLNYNNTGTVDKIVHFGKTGDIPIVGDWDENGISDFGVFRSSTGTWYLDTTKTGNVNISFQFGKSGDIPVVGKWIYAPADSQGIISISPTYTYGNNVPITIIGTNFQQDCTAKLMNNTNLNVVIEARSVRWDSATQVTAWFTIPSPKQRGIYNVIVTNPDGSIRELQNGFEIK
jgi:PKD repeat protein